MNIFDQYGIKEVADVTIYSIHKKEDGSGEVYYVPALYLDTLKISSVEKTAENVWAQGGLGNSRLICWDYGKQINITLEDALCTPASLGLCWGGILNSDWKDGHVEQDFGISFNRNPIEKISRMEKAFYPKNNKDKSSISFLLPQTSDNLEETIVDKIIKTSDIVDGTKVQGMGYVKNRTYQWKMYIESDIKSIAVVPNKFFDKNGQSYPIIQTAAVGVKMPSTTDDFKLEMVYRINFAKGTTGDDNEDILTAEENSIVTIPLGTGDSLIETTISEIKNATYLKIRVDNDNNYYAFIGNSPNNFSDIPRSDIDTSLFKGIDMWQKFDSINEMIYFILTKYENDIYEIGCAEIKDGKITGENYNIANADDTSTEIQRQMNKLWSYINPKTMTPYPDDYWFHQGEPYFIKSLTLS